MEDIAMDSDRESIFSPPGSVTRTDSPERTVERTRFAELSPYINEGIADRIFSTFVDRCGLKKIQELNEQLEGIIEPHVAKSNDHLVMAWCGLSSGSPSFAKVIQKTHQDNYEELIRLAYNLRYPEESSEIPLDEMYDALNEQIPPASKLKDRPNERLDYEWSSEYAQRGFQSQYLKSDIILEPILETLRDNAIKWSPDNYKAPYTAIIGPTMCGKTRLIMELAKKVPVVYICLRSKNSTGLPSRSKLADYLLPECRPEDLQLHYTILLVAIFQAVVDYFSSEEVAHLDQEGQVAAWYEHSFPVDGKNDTGKFAAEVKAKIRSLKKLKGTKRFPTLKAAVSHYSNSRKTQDERLKIILAIDEARNMLVLTGESEVSPFRHLRRVLSQIPSRLGFFALFTDTTSRVANFCPAVKYDPSARLYELGKDLFAPIYQLQTLDLFASKPKTWKEFLSPARLLSYGTPFYGLYFREAEIDIGTEAAISQIMMIAQLKLLFTKQLSPMSRAQVFALLGPLIQPQLYTAWDLNAELLSSHAAHCMYISPARDKVICQYPSQLVYTAAAHHFLASHDAKWVECINGLTLAVLQGLVTIGDAGQLVTNMILIRAMNQTMKLLDNKKPDLSTKEKKPSDRKDSISSQKLKRRRDQKDASTQPNLISPLAERDLIPYGRPVRLKDFLEVLTGKEADEIDLGSTPDELEIKNKLFNEGIIFFNHLILIRYTPNADNFLEYLHRGVAVQCRPGQPGFDQLFPIYLEPNSQPSTSASLNTKNVSFCGIQVKNHQGSVDWTKSKQWTTKKAEIKGIKNPYLVILFNLRGDIPQTQKVLSQDDPERVLLQIHGLGNIGCLTPEIANALDELKTAKPDLMQLGEPDRTTEEWIRSINPQVYPEKTE